MPIGECLDLRAKRRGRQGDNLAWSHVGVIPRDVADMRKHACTETQKENHVVWIIVELIRGVRRNILTSERTSGANGEAGRTIDLVLHITGALETTVGARKVIDRELSCTQYE